MSGEIDHLSRLIGRLEEQMKTLFKKLEILEINSTREHRIVHDIVESTSDAVRTLAAKVDEMKPLTDDYREKRAEARGAARLAKWLYAASGGMIAAVTVKVMEYFGGRLPPPPPHP